MPEGMPKHGETRSVKVLIDGVGYDAQLKNQGFDRTKYDGHADVIQIRYNEGSELVKRLRDMFCSTWNYVESIKNLPENINRKFNIRIPEEQKEFLALSTTGLPNVFVADCITAAVKAEVKTDVSTMSELDFETFEPREDKNASIKQVTRLQKIRNLDRSIGDSLKQLYDYRCQMTGEKVGEPYDSLVVEAFCCSDGGIGGVLVTLPLRRRYAIKFAEGIDEIGEVFETYTGGDLVDAQRGRGEQLLGLSEPDVANEDAG